MKSIISTKKKKARSYGANIWGDPKSPYVKREYAPGQHGQRRKKTTDYGVQLYAKQRLKTYYGNISEKQLPIINCNRISVVLNYAIFLYEIKKDKKNGFDIAQKTFRESMKFFDDLEKPKYRDTLLIIQLLKENIIFWNSEMSEEEEEKKVE